MSESSSASDWQGGFSMNSDFPLFKMLEAMEKWAEGDAETIERERD